MIYRLRQIMDGVYRGSAPTPRDVLRLKKYLGINKIISLDRGAGEKISRACKLVGIEQIKLYIEGKKSLNKALHHNLERLFLDNRPTYIHCFHGKDRTGLLVALFKCRYLGMSPQDALQEAKSLGFGIGVPEDVVKHYKQLIINCQDHNSADIVSNEREYIGDNRDSFLDESRQHSFAPFMDHTKQAPMDAIYNYIDQQSPTRQDYDSYRLIHKYDPREEDQSVVPQVGVFNNDAGIYGVGPTINSGGFIYD